MFYGGCPYTFAMIMILQKLTVYKLADLMMKNTRSDGHNICEVYA
jgi:hypothetical protein